MMGEQVERYIGLKTIFAENARTWTLRAGDAGRRDRKRAFVWYYLVPSPALVFVFAHFPLRNIGALLSGVAVFAGLLFGLLVLMFNTGVTLRKDGAAIASAHDLSGLIGDLRANITYAAIIALTLAVTLALAAVTANSEGAAYWAWTPVVAYLFAHLGLLLLTILRRFRTAFNYITR